MTTLIQNAPEGDLVYHFLDKKRAQAKPYYVYKKLPRIYYGKVKQRLRNLKQEPKHLFHITSFKAGASGGLKFIPKNIRSDF